VGLGKSFMVALAWQLGDCETEPDPAGRVCS